VRSALRGCVFAGAQTAAAMHSDLMWESSASALQLANGLVGRARGRSEQSHDPLSRHAVELCDPLGAETFLAQCPGLGRPETVSDVVQLEHVRRENLHEERVLGVLVNLGVRVAGKSPLPDLDRTFESDCRAGQVLGEGLDNKINRLEDFI
jgi:hypothetical protein